MRNFSKCIFICVLFLNLLVNAQKQQLKGKVEDVNNRGIQTASILVFDNQSKNLGYAFTDEAGNYQVSYYLPADKIITIETSSLGFGKEIRVVKDTLDVIQNFTLNAKLETLNEVVIKAGKKIKVVQDTTTIAIRSFVNNTELTVEDILKKLPGIDVSKDGTIRAHGKTIDKLLIDGEDMFGKNYKILSKNLDSKVLTEVQIIDNFEDNPIFKKLNNSNKVALNLKIDKSKKNIWFGNLLLGSGVFSDSRWKESINLGLLKKGIKFFYFGNYNNTGEKATDLINSTVIENSTFGNDRFEYKAKPFYVINSGEANFFTETQTSFNNSFLNSISFTSKINNKLSIRGVVYLAEDKMKQNSLSQTKYNFEDSPVSYFENNDYVGKKSISSTELELKYFNGDKSYITNLFVFRDAPIKASSELLFNVNLIDQFTKSSNLTFYNHFNHTLQVSKNKVLSNYFYFGNDKVVENSTLSSPLLNDFLNIDEGLNIDQVGKNKVLFTGYKSKLISKYNKIDIINSLQFEYNQEKFSNSFSVNKRRFSEFENDLKLNQFKIFFENTLRYNISKKIDFSSSLVFQHLNFDVNSAKNNNLSISPTFSLNIRKTGFGNFTFSFAENYIMPEIDQLLYNYQIVDYRTFQKGIFFHKPVKESLANLSYNFYDDEKRLSVSTNFMYKNSRSDFNTESTITDEFIFNELDHTKGGDSFILKTSFVNYIKKLKLVSKLEMNSIWNSSPIKVNSLSFVEAKSSTATFKYTGSTYFKSPINFVLGFSYNYSESQFNKIKSQNVSKDFYLNLNYAISKTLNTEVSNSFYFIKGQDYLFNSINLSYNPIKSRFSHRLVFNNIKNENSFKYISLNYYMFYQSNVQLVPRYLLYTIKYHF